MDDTDPKPMTEGDATPPPFGTEFKPAEPLKDEGASFTADAAQGASGGGETEPPAHDDAHAASAVDTIKSGAQKLTDQAGDQVRTLVDQGKGRATGALDQLAQLITDAAGQVDDKLGGHYGDYARQAAGQVSGIADQIRDKEVEELLEDVRGLVRRAPGVAIGVSAALGFVVARLVSAGLDGREGA